MCSLSTENLAGVIYFKPSILFIDEFDGFCSARSSKDSDTTYKIKTELLQQISQDYEVNLSWAVKIAVIQGNNF